MSAREDGREWDGILDVATATLKRLCWAYGCAKKGSEQERAFLAALVQRIQGGLAA